MLQTREKFTDSDKLKLDQYIMHGGKLLIALDVRCIMDACAPAMKPWFLTEDLDLQDLFL